MEISIKYAILFLTISPALICLGHAAGCGGSCSISGTISSYDFLGDTPFNPSMDTFDDFVRDKAGLTYLSTKSISAGSISTNASLNQTSKGNVSLNNITSYNANGNAGDGQPGNTAAGSVASGTQDVRQSTFASNIFNNNMF